MYFQKLCLFYLEYYSDIMFKISFSLLGFYVNQLYYAKELYIFYCKMGYFLKMVIYFSRDSILMIKIYEMDTTNIYMRPSFFGIDCIIDFNLINQRFFFTYLNNFFFFYFFQFNLFFASIIIIIIFCKN